MDILLLLLTILPFVASFPELTHDGRVIQHPGLIRYPIAVSEAPPHTKRYFRRQDNADLTSQSTGFFYTIDVVIGTPGQSVPLGFDTGSWEFWVNPNCSNTAEKTVCRSFPRFTGSTTLVNTNRTGQITYGAGYAKFNYMYDFVSVGTARINQQIFGVAYDTAVVAYGNFGVGPWILGWRSPYPSVLDSLVNQNHINRKAFSLDLRPINNPRGAVIFGGIDTKKYTGPLEKRPIITGPDGSTRYWVYLDGLSVTREDGSQLPVFDEANSLTVLLDSGTTLTQLPTKMVTEILKAFPSARQDPDNKGQYLVDCSVANLAGTVNFRFGNTSIRAQYNDFIWKQPQNNLCILGVSPNDCE
ncbi:hypothetical protein QQS21_001957 [Conoideocrella luteorostrata]|uniref:Peptidase A1 domain-containing protein n=1 Tax=Conoideocrella luteorostrata TaxID=1105319 RepID=A0AAJ0CZY4_9HYPO|nr:hypothetical protein QQS21_001957 [Conoideocrella luteorostrata]